MQLPYYLLASLALAIFLASGRLTEDGSLPRNCQDIREQGFTQVGHYVVYHTVNNSTEDATMIYCDEKNGMQLLEEEDGATPRSGPTNCKILQDQGMIHDGYANIYPFSDHPETPILVFCDQTTEGGGWTVIHRRDENYEDPTDFQRSFEEYAAGFGDVNYDFYIGNEVIHSLTDASINELRVDIKDTDGWSGYAHYQYFHVGARDADVLYEPPYMLDTGFYEGTIGEGLGHHNGMGFSTYDQDNDIKEDLNCAEQYHSGWWHMNCFTSNLNCPYEDTYFRWLTKEANYKLSKAQMMVRPLAA